MQLHMMLMQKHNKSSLFRLFRNVPPHWNTQNACKLLIYKEFFFFYCNVPLYQYITHGYGNILLVNSVNQSNKSAVAGFLASALFHWNKGTG